MPAPINPEADPQYQAFLRSQGFAESDLRAQIAQKKAEAQRQYQSRLPGIQEAERVALEDAWKSHLARGFFGGGEQQTAEAQARAERGRQMTTLQGELTSQLGAFELDLSRGVANLQRQKAEEEMMARGRLAQAFAQQEAERRAQQQAAQFAQQQAAAFAQQQAATQSRGGVTGFFEGVGGMAGIAQRTQPSQRRASRSGARLF